MVILDEKEIVMSNRITLMGISFQYVPSAVSEGPKYANRLGRPSKIRIRGVLTMKTVMEKYGVSAMAAAGLVIMSSMILIPWFYPEHRIPAEHRINYLASSAGRMEANIGCWPTSLKSLNNRFYQMEPESNSCNKKIPAAFTEVYYATRNGGLHGLKKFARNKAEPILVSVGSSPLDKKSFGIIISNLNNQALRELGSTFRKSDPVPFNGASLFLAFNHYQPVYGG